MVYGGRLPFHLLGRRGGRYRRFHPGGLLHRVRQHQAAELAEERVILRDPAACSFLTRYE